MGIVTDNLTPLGEAGNTARLHLEARGSALPNKPLAVLRTNPDGAGSVQAIGPLKTLAPGESAASAASSRRILIVTDPKDASQVVLRQAGGPSQ